MTIETVLGIDGRRLATIVRQPVVRKEAVDFYSNCEDSLQLGVMQWPAGYSLAPHIHNPPNRMVKPAEVLFVFSGRVRVDIYDEHRNEPELSLHRAVVLDGGDIIVLLDGGHGFEFLEESVVWEVKTGPYLATDKTWMAGPSKHSPPAKPVYAVPSLT